MNRVLRIVVGTSAAVVMALSIVQAAPQQAPATATQALPTGRELLAKSVTALGGEAAITAIKSVHASGTFELPAQKLSGSVEMYAARPALVRLSVEVTGLGRIESGSDGKIAWSSDPISGPSLLSGKALNEAIADAQFDAQLNAPSYIKEATTLARTTFAGRPAFKLKVVTTYGTESVDYIDAENFLPIGSEKTSETPMGPVPTVTVIGGYKKFGSMLQPTTMTQTAMGFDQIFTITNYEYDGVPASAFEPPPAVKALIK